jgi:hypothetical protein
MSCRKTEEVERDSPMFNWVYYILQLEPMVPFNGESSSDAEKEILEKVSHRISRESKTRATRSRAREEVNDKESSSHGTTTSRVPLGIGTKE